MLQGGRSRVRFPVELLGFLIDLILPGVDSASSKNEYEGYVLRWYGAYGLQSCHLHVPIV